MAYVLGITGGIGTGKSTALKIFGSLGAKTLSADDIAREMLSKGTSAYRDVLEHFGKEILREDGEIDRAKLGSIVFRDPEARAMLNDITHPRIVSQIEEKIREFRKDHQERGAVLAVEIPLLVECGLNTIVDEVLLIAAEQGTQLSRLTSRSGLSSEEALLRINAQMPMSEKTHHADRVIWNDGPIECLQRAVRGVWDEIRLL